MFCHLQDESRADKCNGLAPVSEAEEDGEGAHKAATVHGDRVFDSAEKIKKKKKLYNRETASLFSAGPARVFNVRKSSSIHNVGHYRKKSGVTTYKEVGFPWGWCVSFIVIFFF